MTAKITRRDLLNGMAISVGGLVFDAYGAGPSKQRNATQHSTNWPWVTKTFTTRQP